MTKEQLLILCWLPLTLLLHLLSPFLLELYKICWLITHRPTRNFGEPIGGFVAPSAPITKQQISTHSQPVAVSQIADQSAADGGMTQNPFPSVQPASLEVSRKYVQTAQTPEVTGSSQPSAPQAQKQPHVLPQSTQNSEQRHSSQSTRQEVLFSC